MYACCPFLLRVSTLSHQWRFYAGAGGGLGPPSNFCPSQPVFPPITYYCDGRHNVRDIVWCRYTSLQVYIHVNISIISLQPAFISG